MRKNFFISLTKKKINFNNFDFLYDNKNGAIYSFFGIVRNINRKKEVSYIFYDVFENLFLEILKKKCINLLKNDNNSKILIKQFSGKLFVGEINLFVGASSFHRKNAYFYCNEIVEFLKNEIPIWKKEVYKDNSFFWINSF